MMDIHFRTVPRKQQVTITETTCGKRLLYIVHNEDGRFTFVDPFLVLPSVLFDTMNEAKAYVVSVMQSITTEDCT
jgi:hypothetical protein